MDMGMLNAIYMLRVLHYYLNVTHRAQLAVKGWFSSLLAFKFLSTFPDKVFGNRKGNINQKGLRRQFSAL